ncbi:hypothetical protein LTR78_004783 [Recurvomyces mirabilis]|uniref:Glycerophosphocholine acyltransferase 1 n=1 Tax=Recurvomyces mirabilis TaxID=574656 RepID=A0AAE1C243_9PEZI|nr:hypothetical protein LTR78_004783 [Recurvomyces mirabilis]KAK5157954.1 hypothetical protein LTS14_003877 [Recurvomyces mirabilis]
MSGATSLTVNSKLRSPFYAGRGSSYLDIVPEEDEYGDEDEDGFSEAELESFAKMDDIMDPQPKISKSRSMPGDVDQMGPAKEESAKRYSMDSKRSSYLQTPYNDGEAVDYLSVISTNTNGYNTPSTPGLTRSSSQTELSNFDAFGNNDFPPVDRLTMFDILENLALPQRLEKMQNVVHNQAEKVRRQRAKLASRALSSKNNLVEEWRKRVKVRPEEQLDKYRKRMRESVDRLGRRWTDAKTVTLKEKISFVTAVLNIFISAYMIGAYPQYFHYWYSLQLAYFMPLRWYSYQKIGFHYFLADLCYFVNLLLILAIWFFPQSKRLFISTYCLAFGNNAVAIAFWRNSLVFHSLDKTTTLFIHIMPCATLHVLVHLIPESMQLEHFPAIHTIKYSLPGAPEHYSLWDMMIWATLPYAVWQLSYHFLITVRKRSKIAAGRPTSFSWLRRSYRGNFLGKFVLSFPENFQEYVFMGIQYTYAIMTMMPCPIWFWYRWASAGFMMIVFTWASWNGATYYIDVFGKRMEKELESLRKEVQRMAKSPEMVGQEGGGSPFMSPQGPTGMDGASVGGGGGGVGRSSALDLGPAATNESLDGRRHHTRVGSDDSGIWAQYAGQHHTQHSQQQQQQGMDGGGGLASAPETPGLELKKAPLDSALNGGGGKKLGGHRVNGSLTDASITDASTTDGDGDGDVSFAESVTSTEEEG